MNGRSGLLGPLVLAAMLLVFAGPASAGPVTQSLVPNGTVVALEGTPHVWIADDQGVLHWGGDTRALAGRFVNWNDRRPVNLAQLRSFRIGDPWLSAGLLKVNDPIYLVKWEGGQERPTLLHIQCIADVQIFGITGTNYGDFVLDQASWEQRFGIGVSSLTKGELASSCAATAIPVTVTPTPTRSTLRVREGRVNNLGGIPVPSFETIVELTGAPLGQRLTVSLEYEDYRCSSLPCGVTGRDRWGPRDAGPVDASGRLIYRDRHGPYKNYTYTFEEASGYKVIHTFGDDLSL